LKRKELPGVFFVILLFFMSIEQSILYTSADPASPIAKFTFIPAIPYVNDTLTFDASSSKAGEGSIIRYAWDFGDNTTGAGWLVEKSYTKDGDYTVTLTVTNDAEANATASKSITILPNPFPAAIDLYNQNGGQGPNQPSGGFKPGDVVILSALLTYNGSPVEYKPVAFEVRDASGETVLFRSNFTDVNGVASINFTIYVDCLPHIIGTWMAVAVSTVSEVKVSDTLTFNVAGIFLDIYTQKPEPYSGRGPNAWSDAFAPQEEVILYGEAHWNCEPIEYKFVNFEVRDPTGKVIDYRVSPTDQNGIANASFRLASNATFGIYTVFGTVEILGKIGTDTLYFRVGWIIENLGLLTVNEIGAPKTIFAREEHVCFNLTAKNIAFTPRFVTFTIAVYDVTDVTIGCIVLGDLLMDPGASQIFIVSIEIPSWAFVGTASAYANANTGLPSAGGVAYCPEVFTVFTITS
jgi:PKD repeat protein